MSFGQRGGYNRGGFGGGGSSSGGGFRSFKPKPVEVGKEYDVTISDISRRGDGIAKIDGFVIFVPGTKQGQQVRIKVTQVSNRYASGQLVEGSVAAAPSEVASSEVEESTEGSAEQ
jgi:predicted RNA-binding protein with TRAM domain